MELKRSEVVLLNLKNPNPCPWLDSIATQDQLGLAYICANLRSSDYQAEIIDAASFNINEEEICNQIKKINPVLVGIGPDFSTIQVALRVASKIKHQDQNIKIVMGGHHVSFSALEILSQERNIDFIIRGEGEIPILALTRTLENRKSLSSVPGLVYRTNNGSISFNNTPTAIEDLDRLPFPSRDILKASIELGKPRASGILTSRGCAMHCTFCSTPPFVKLNSGVKWRARSAKNVVEEIEILVNNYGVEFIFIRDDDFLGNNQEGIERAKLIAEELISRKINIRFRFLCRARSLMEGGEKLLSLLKKAGLVRVFLGIEASCPKSLKLYGKGGQLQFSQSAIRLLQKHNIAVHVGFITFNPYTTFEELENSISFLASSGLGVSYKNISDRLELYPGTRIIEKLKNDNLLSSYNPCKGNAYAYYYENPDIKRLSEFLVSIRDEVVFLDKLILDIDLMNVVGTTNQFSSIKKEILDTNVQFFTKCIDLANKRTSDDEFGKVIANYVSEIDKLRKRLELLQSSYVQTLQAV